MNKIYLVWYKLKEDKEDRIRGAALTWQRAERMAENLEMHLKSIKIKDFEFGVKSYICNSIGLDIIDDGAAGRWTKDKFEKG